MTRNLKCSTACELENLENEMIQSKLTNNENDDEMAHGVMLNENGNNSSQKCNERMTSGQISIY